MYSVSKIEKQSAITRNYRIVQIVRAFDDGHLERFRNMFFFAFIIRKFHNYFLASRFIAWMVCKESIEKKEEERRESQMEKEKIV